MTNDTHEQDLGEARSLLESMALLEKVAAAREAKAEQVIASLVSEGMTSRELAQHLDISKESVEALIERDAPRPPHERAGISEQSLESLDPTETEASEAV